MGICLFFSKSLSLSKKVLADFGSLSCRLFLHRLFIEQQENSLQSHRVRKVRRAHHERRKTDLTLSVSKGSAFSASAR
jgi:hypothetical protein